MKFKITSKDPFGVLSSTKPIVESLEYVKIHEEKLDQLAVIIKSKLDGGINFTQEMQFGNAGTLKDNVQLIFLEDTVNFCFWAEKGKEKWTVEWPEGKFSDGWFALTACFQRAIFQKKRVLNAEYLENLSQEETLSIFSSSNTAEIPLLEQRMRNLREAGKVLKEKYSGEVINVLEEGKFDAINIVKILIKEFTSFRDIAFLNGREIYFLKRAQICALDMSYLKGMKIKNINSLSGFADYKLPQVFRKFSVFSYSHELLEKIDNYILIPKGSREEIEIRAATIWCIELVRQRLKKFSSGDVDNALWLTSQKNSDIKPYHRTYSIFY
jgi:hypothetical protein